MSIKKVKEKLCALNRDAEPGSIEQRHTVAVIKMVEACPTNKAQLIRDLETAHRFSEKGFRLLLCATIWDLKN